MTATEIKRTLLTAHEQYGFFPREVVKSILKEEQRPDVRSIDVICCMLELVYTGKNKET